MFAVKLITHDDTIAPHFANRINTHNTKPTQRVATPHLVQRKWLTEIEVWLGLFCQIVTISFHQRTQLTISDAKCMLANLPLLKINVLLLNLLTM